MSTGSAATEVRVRRASRGGALAAVIVLLCGLTLALAYANKARCAGAPFYENGRSTVFDVIKDSDVCYSDIQFLWLGRDIDRHVFPYVDGGITDDGLLTGGAVEYPVLSGTLMWVGAIGAETDADFLRLSALLLAPFALLTAWFLARLAGRAALLWAIGPPLVLYAFHNWELPVVCTAVAAVYVVTMATRYSLRTRAVLAAVLLGLGFCLKLYPGIFVLPLMIYVLTGGAERDPDDDSGLDWRGALATAGAAIGTVVAVNLPFALIGYEGWRASITFQQLRQADITTNSIWYWGHHLLYGRETETSQSWHDGVSIASPVLILAAFVLAVWLGWKRYRATGVFPWVGVSGAMLCGFLVFHKVHSPQYTLWLIPFLVLLAVPWQVIGAYLLADAAIGIGVFRYFYAMGSGAPFEIQETIVQFGVWGRAILLVALFFLFIRADPRGSNVKSARATPDRGDLVAA
ncbi:putative membrane protein [Nocardia amikacinitolerans]|uniref:glycosyltransferase family 87 protein n=1 Tax=Nocardia amikacinitolerans TaxID=756689 RepID=UPI000830FA53|nr:glycosyltransferase 87 family protein [Nocardia amikacinitolerans]MCP2320458.1 putative membrane protein [Nocardia amikacinitolerans]